MENIELNKISTQFLYNIFDDLKKYNLSFDISNFPSHIKSFSNSQLNSIPNFSIYNKKVVQCITEMDKEIHTYKFKVNKRNIETFIILNKNKQNKKKNLFIMLLKKHILGYLLWINFQMRIVLKIYKYTYLCHHL